MEPSELLSKLDRSKLPKHVAVIMDGNGRWAKRHRLSRINGHKKGITAVEEVVRFSREIGIRYLTLYAFSTENWLRPKREIDALMGLLKEYLNKKLPEMMENRIRLLAIGEIENLPKDVYSTLKETMEATSNNNGMTLILALSYGGRKEILRAVREIGKKIEGGEISIEEIDEETFSRHLFTGGIPDPDLLIRTSGEMRVSNFLLWQIAYTELYITPVLWPDFRKEHLLEAILEYQRRERRFGGI